MAHHCSSPSSRSPASRSRTPSEPFAGSGMATPGGTPTPELPPLGISSGQCGDAVEEHIPGLGGSITGNPSGGRRNDTGAPGGCSFFKTQEEYEAILRDRGLLGPAAATPQQGQGRGCYFTSGPSGFLIPEPVRNTNKFAAVEDLKDEIVALKLEITQLTTDIEERKLEITQLTTDIEERKLEITQLTTDIEERNLEITQLTTHIEERKRKLVAGDKVQKDAKTESPARRAKGIVKWRFVANVVILLFGIVVAMSVKCLVPSVSSGSPLPSGWWNQVID